MDREEALRILSMFRDNPQEFWIEPDMIKAAIEKIKSLHGRWKYINTINSL